MSSVKIINVHQSIDAKNDAIAANIRLKNKKNGTFMINLMASPGAGKTTLLLKTAEKLKNKYKIGVIEADIDSDVDATKMDLAGIHSIQIHTGGECAMDAEMTEEAINEFSTDTMDLLVVENVGNLVCPAENDIGATRNVAILSVPEGDDKPLKYPLMFEVCQAIIISKTDTLPYFNFNKENVKKNILTRNPDAEIFFLSAKNEEGFDKWTDWIENEIKNQS